ncbi:unnamed protein product, partial [Ixodes hexagonus]
MSSSGQTVDISVKSFICDAQAQYLVYSIKGHKGYSERPKCIVGGMCANNRVIFPSVTSTLRTDESYRCQTDPDRHHGVSALTLLPINFISSAPLDCMHPLCLGSDKQVAQPMAGWSFECSSLGPVDRRQLSE